LGKLAEVKAYRLRLRELNDGPRFATLRISPSLPPRVLPPRDGVFLKNRFRATLGIQVG